VIIKRAVLKDFNATDYRATVQLSGSRQAYLEAITVARNIAAAEMINGREVAILFFDEHYPKTAVIMAVYT